MGFGLDHLVQHDEQLAHAGGHGDLVQLAPRHQSLEVEAEALAALPRVEGGHERQARTSARPPPILRWPRKRPESRFSGARPASLAISWRLSSPSSGSSATSWLAVPGPMPGTESMIRALPPRPSRGGRLVPLLSSAST